MLLLNTDYRVLYNSVLSKIKDYDFFKLNQSEVNAILFDYIRPAIVRFYSCKQDLSKRDDSIQCFKIELTDDEIEILSDFMVVEYLDSNYIRVPSALKQILSNKDFNTYSPSNLLEKVTSVRKQYLDEARQLMIDYSYKDSTLFDIGRK